MNEFIASGFARSPGLATGFKGLDRTTAGLFPGEVTIVAGPTGDGKTTLVTNVMTNVAETGTPVGMLSLEMNEAVIRDRLIAERIGMSVNELRRAKITGPLKRKQEAQARALSKLPFLIADVAGISPEQARDTIAHWGTEEGVGLAVLDYVQMMGGGDNRNASVADSIRAIREGAKLAGIPVIVVSQMNREVYRRGGNRRPQISDLRDSGELENVADCIWFLWRPPEPEEGEGWSELDAYVVVAKGRNGERGEVKLQFDPQKGRYVDRHP